MPMNSNTDFNRRHYLKVYMLQDGVCDICKDRICFDPSPYHCPTCKSVFHKDCLTISNPKIHEHTLTFIHRKNDFVCDACGSTHGDVMNMFGCLQCDFFVHKSCVSLPRAIKVTRHPHRLSHSFCISDGNRHCGVCHKILKMDFGGYTCVDKACNYAIHSNCATDRLVWDGKDVHGEPEEEDHSKVALESFLEISGGNIRHFSHHHELMTLYVEVGDESGMVCQACILPIDFGNFFGCKECDFTLHDTCARLPRTMEHLLHRHQLTLQVYDINMEQGFFNCSACHRNSCGFMYQCCQEDCFYQIDVRCASIVEPFIHIAHPDPLLLRIKRRDIGNQYCDCCYKFAATSMGCGSCYFQMDLECVTLPNLVTHKYDIHPLTLCHHELLRWRSILWCELCEEIINESKLFYACLICRCILHVECTIGRNPYLKPEHWIKVNGLEIQIVSNRNASRPICFTCGQVCQDKLIFTERDRDVYFCKMFCISVPPNRMEYITSD